MKENVLIDKSIIFAARIVKLHDYLIKNKKGLTIAKQIIRSGTSIGANINEVSIACELKSPYGRDNALYHLRFTYRGNVYYFVVDADTGFIVEFLNEPIV